MSLGGKLTSLYYELTPQGVEFFSSNNKANLAKAYVAYCPTMAQANDVLRRRGYPLQLRKRVLKTFGKYLANPEMTGVTFSELGGHGIASWWAELDHVGPEESLEYILATYGPSS